MQQLIKFSTILYLGSDFQKGFTMTREGKEFNNKLFYRLHQLAGIGKSRTTPYHPMGDGHTERMNRTLVNMLKTLGKKEKQDWKVHLSKLAFAYNVTINKTTQYSPYYLMFGRTPNLPIDEIFDIKTMGGDIQQSHQKYVQNWQKAMNQAFEIVKNHSRESGERNRKYYNKKVHGVDIEVGDRVLLRNHKERGGTGKLRNYWEDVIYVVIEKHSEIPVFTIKPEVGNGKSRKVHRNNIMSCNLLKEITEETPTESKKKKKKRQLEESSLEIPMILKRNRSRKSKTSRIGSECCSRFR